MLRFRSNKKTRTLMLVLAFVTATATMALAAPDVQVVALETLKRQSRIPLRIDFDGGTARSASFDVAAYGTAPVEQARTFLTEYADLFLRAADPKLGGGPHRQPAVALRARGVWDGDDTKVVGFYQSFGGVPVFAGDIYVVLRNDPFAGPRVVSAHGSLLSALQPNLDVVPAISSDQAAAIAAADLDKKGAPSLGQPMLMVFSEQTARGRGDARLVWAVGVGGKNPTQVLVDAHAGTVAFKHALTAEGTIADDYDLDLEDANGNNIVDTNCFNPTTVDDFIGDEDGIISAYMNDPDATNGWWHLYDTYAYYHDSLNRHSWDDDDEQIQVYLHSDFATNNGQYSHGCGMEFTNGYISLDVTAHEFTHGVIRYSPSNLVYSYQPGALNESFADVMGEMVDPDGDWLHREDILNGSGPNRSLKDPANDLCGPAGAQFSCGQPDRWSAYVGTTDDNGGVHTNSGIPNKAAYLMVEGGDFNGIAVGTGMGRGFFERLAYYVLRYLPSQASFIDARNLYVATALDWANHGTNGFNGDHVCAVRNAWAAVEIGRSLKDEDCDGIEDNIDDSDGDGLLHDVDNCPNNSNPAQEDWDSDGDGDACDLDTDGDGCPNGQDLCEFFDSGPCYGPFGELDFDGDGLGPACDPDDDNDGVLDEVDNCPIDPNPDQFDGNQDGYGDACDPDVDGDGLYVLEDNCTFIWNPDQVDSDGDGLGDVCDRCAETADNSNAYTTGIPELGIDPVPFQPDSDNDGQPDACDLLNFGAMGVLVDAFPFNAADGKLSPDGRQRSLDLIGSGGHFRLPLALCSGDDRDVFDAGERVQLVIQGLEDSMPINFWVSNELDERLESLSRTVDTERGLARGLRFQPDCRKRYFLHGAADGKFGGQTALSLVLERVAAGQGNPWSTPFGSEKTVRPHPIADVDSDGIIDRLDNCPRVFNATQSDTDFDGVGDACDDVPVAIDVVPGVYPNLINVSAGGFVDVAILGSDSFDVARVERDSVRFADASPRQTVRVIVSNKTDVNSDGRPDLVLQFAIADLRLDPRATYAMLSGSTRDGVSFRGFDSIQLVSRSIK